MSEYIRIRVIRIPSARDLEYLAMRYIRLNGVYDVPLTMAAEFVELGFASPAGEGDSVDDLSDPLPDDLDED